MNNSRKAFFRLLFQKIKTSLSSKDKIVSQFKGTDLFGNEFFETNIKDARGQYTRHVLPKQKDETLPNISPEWQSWLRHQRLHPPTKEELIENKNIALGKKSKAEQIVKQHIQQYPDYIEKVKEIRDKQEERDSVNEYNPQFRKFKNFENAPGSGLSKNSKV